MHYTSYGQTGIEVSQLGLGTNRFKFSVKPTPEEIDSAVQIVVTALQNGVNYIDTSYTYSKGMAEKIIALAIQSSSMKPHMVVKSAVSVDKTADDVLRRIEESLTALHIDCASFFLAWTISSYQEYLSIMKKGGYYEGAVKAKNRGLIDHICFATCCPPDESIRIIEEGAFEGITINYSVTNDQLGSRVLDAAAKAGIGVTAMSVLGTGMIPKHPDFFNFIKMDETETVPQAALKFVAANPAVKVVLSGASSMQQITSNLSAFQETDQFQCERQHTVHSRLYDQVQYCNGCGKCNICPEHIPVATFMQSYNAKNFANTSIPEYRRTQPDLIENIEIFKMMQEELTYMIPSTENPCTRCKICENMCPQKINIADCVNDLYMRAKKSGYTVQAHKERLKSKFGQYNKIALYPAGGYTGYLLEMYHSLVGEPKMTICMFDSNPKLWGKTNNGIVIQSPSMIAANHPDCVLITNFIYSDEIAEQLAYLKDNGIPIVKFHEQDDVPWIY